MRAATTGYPYRVLIQVYRGKRIHFNISEMRPLGRQFMRKCRPNMRGNPAFVDKICVNR
jgi:hypothetical protein